jgi:hypothetical protein
MNTRKARDPKVDPSRQDLERALCAALIPVWDDKLVSVIAGAIRNQSALAHTYREWYAAKDMPNMSEDLEAAAELLMGINRARAFYEVLAASD